MKVLGVKAEGEMIISPDSGTQLLTKGMGRVCRWYQTLGDKQRKEGSGFSLFVFKEEGVSSSFCNRRNQTR